MAEEVTELRRRASRPWPLLYLKDNQSGLPLVGQTTHHEAAMAHNTGPSPELPAHQKPLIISHTEQAIKIDDSCG